MLSTQEPAQWSSDRTLEAIWELAPAQGSVALAAGGASVVGERGALQNLDYTYGYPARLSFVLGMERPRIGADRAEWCA